MKKTDKMGQPIPQDLSGPIFNPKNVDEEPISYRLIPRRVEIARFWQPPE